MEDMAACRGSVLALPGKCSCGRGRTEKEKHLKDIAVISTGLGGKEEREGPTLGISRR